MSMTLTKWLLLAIIILGGLARLIQLGSNPVSMYWDEGAIAYDAYSLATTGHDMHGKSWLQPMFLSYGDYKAPVYIWLAGLSVKFLGPTVAAVRLPSALAGTLLIFIVYLIGKELFNKQIGLFSALILAISPWGIQFSRTAFEANVATLLVTIVVYLALKAKNKPSFYLVSAIFGALATYGYFSVRVVFPLVYLLVFAYNLGWKSKKSWSGFLVGMMIFGGSLIPLIKSPDYAASNQFRLSSRSILNTNDHVVESSTIRDWQGNSLISRLIYHRDIFLVKRLAENVASHFDPRYLFFYGDVNLRHSTTQVGLFVLPMMFLLIAAFFLIPSKYRWQLGLLLSWWLVAVIPASVPLEVPHALRSLNALPAVSLILGIGGWYLWQSVKHRYWGRMIMLGLGLWIGLSFGYYLHDYWIHYPARSATAWQYGYEQLANTIGKYAPTFTTIEIDDIDRFHNYLLFFNKIDPKTVQNANLISWGAPIKFLNYEIGQTHMNSQPACGRLTVLTAIHYQQQAKTYIPLEIINDYGGKPLYYLIGQACPTQNKI
jgi:4-amino-4-deoxy-L-arabinose transferase-like glycosyltransferase